MNLIDLTNQRFGKLVVKERDLSYTKKGTYWICQCDCGNTISARKDQLTRKKYPKQSCGCDLSKKISQASLKNEIGNRYGKLVVIKRAPDLRKGEARWVCQCDCGQICEVSGLHLRNGTTKSCGCLLYDSKNGIDETGNRYGKLTVLYRSDKTDGAHIFWHCKCDCGNEVDVKGTYLRNGVSTHCGCQKSSGETIIAKILLDNNISFIREYTFPDLIGEKGHRLRFDFAIFTKDNQLSHLVEYDGVQHFDKRCFNQTEEEFTLLKKYDKMKTEYCQKNNIRLIRIKYTNIKNITLNILL